MSRDADVIVVGAGVAGLAAAKELSRLGLTSVVIEGSHRICGRACAEEIAPEIWFDLGCAWLVGGEANPFTHIAEAMGIALVKDKRAEFGLGKHRFHRNGSALSPEDRRACVAYYNTCNEAIERAAHEGRDVAISEVIDTQNPFAPPFMGAVANAWGLDVDMLSTVDYATPGGDIEYRVVRGLGNLTAAWAADVIVQLDTPARRIDWTGKDIRVTTPNGHLTARTVLITVSTGILASDEIRFVPDLPNWKQEAITSLPMGTENKIGLHFDHDIFGPDGRAYYTIWKDGEVAAKVDADVVGLDTAVVLVGGRFAVGLESEGPEALTEFAVDRVADIFGNDIRKHVSRAIPTAWNTNPWTRGSWACALPGQAHQRAELARPVDGRLFFAGEATIYGAQGTCDGAHDSGIRAAREIAACLRPGQDIGPQDVSVARKTEKENSQTG